MSSNMYDLLNNDEQHSKKPQHQEGPGKPDKTEQRRSVPKSARPDASGVATGTSAPAPRQRVDARERTGRGGRGGARGGRGGYHGETSDGVHRNFDRKQGAHGKHAPGEARKDGAVGEVDPSQFQGSSSEFAAQDAAQVADANGDIVGDMILDVTPMAADPDDSKMTYDEYLAQKARVDEDVNRQTREVIVDEENFVKVKQFQKEEEETFFDLVKAAPKAQKDESAAKKGKKKNIISLDEFVGVSGPVASTETGEREGQRGGRGGRGGSFAPRGGRGGFRGDSSSGEPRERREYTPREPRADGAAPTRGGRGGRGGFRGESGAPRGRGAPRGAYTGASRSGAPAANVNIADQSAFPALSPK